MNRKVGRPVLLAIIAEGFFSRLSFGVIGFALPLYAYNLGMSLSTISLLASINVGAEILLKPYASARVDRLGLKRSLSIAIGLRSLIGLFLSLVSAPWQLLAIRMLQGAAESLRDPALNTLIAEGSGPNEIASSYAWYSTAKSVAGSLGKALAGILITVTAANYPLVFLVGFALSALPLYAVLRFVPANAGSIPKVDAAAPKPAPALSRSASSRGVGPYFLLGILISGTASMLNSLFPVLATKYAGLTPAQAGMIYGLSTVVIILAGPLFGWISDHVSRKLVLTVRSIANTVSSIIYIFFPSFAGIAIGKIVDDVGKAAFRPAWGALMAEVSGEDRSRRAHTMGMLSLGDNLGEVGGPALAGLLWHFWGLPAMLAVRAGLALLTEIYALSLRRAPGQSQLGPAARSREPKIMMHNLTFPNAGQPGPAAGSLEPHYWGNRSGRSLQGHAVRQQLQSPSAFELHQYTSTEDGADH